jgi:predicted nucleic acid-binding Zn ribbon protein
MKKKNDISLQDAMKDMLQEFKLQPQLNETRIRQVWEKLMGKTIATYTSKVSLHKNVLTITILSAPLKHELTYGKALICKRINEELGEEVVTEVVIR